MQAGSSVASRGAARLHLARPASSQRAGSRGSRLVVQAKVDLKGGPRVLRGKCFVTKDVSGPSTPNPVAA